MNTYVLFCQTLKVKNVAKLLNRKDEIKAVIPRMEVYMRETDDIVLKVMFPRYLFIQSPLNQDKFTRLLWSLHEEKKGIIKELKKEDVSALSDEKIELLKRLLNKNGVLKMNEGFKENGKTIVTKGSLISFQEYIVDSDK